MPGRLEGKVCIITGTFGSISAVAARLFTREGAHVVGCDVNAQQGGAVMNEVVAAWGTMISVQRSISPRLKSVSA